MQRVQQVQWVYHDWRWVETRQFLSYGPRTGDPFRGSLTLDKVR
jgi:hypothetical protein